MIRLSQVTLIRGTKTLLEEADVTLNPGDKIGLIGPNGSGKSSLFALLRGELHADRGEVDFPARWRIAHVAQETPALERAAIEYAIDGDTTLRRLQRELAEAEAAEDSELDGVRMGHLHAALADAGAYSARSRAERLLHGVRRGQGVPAARPGRAGELGVEVDVVRAGEVRPFVVVAPLADGTEVVLHVDDDDVSESATQVLRADQRAHGPHPTAAPAPSRSVAP